MTVPTSGRGRTGVIPSSASSLRRTSNNTRTRGSTIASRYLEAINCGGGDFAGLSSTTPILVPGNDGDDDGNGNDNDTNKNDGDNVRSSKNKSKRSTRNTSSNNSNTADDRNSSSSSSYFSIRTQRATNGTHQRRQTQYGEVAVVSTPSTTATTIYNKINAVAKVADCSRSIVTASTATMMVDPSSEDSASLSAIATATTGDGRSTSNSNNYNVNNSVINNNNYSSGGEVEGRSNNTSTYTNRRGRSRTPIEFGTNSIVRNIDPNTNNTCNDYTTEKNNNDNNNGSTYHTRTTTRTSAISIIGKNTGSNHATSTDNNNWVMYAKTSSNININSNSNSSSRWRMPQNKNSTTKNHYANNNANNNNNNNDNVTISNNDDDHHDHDRDSSSSSQTTSSSIESSGSTRYLSVTESPMGNNNNDNNNNNSSSSSITTFSNNNNIIFINDDDDACIQKSNSTCNEKEDNNTGSIEDDNGSRRSNSNKSDEKNWEDNNSSRSSIWDNHTKKTNKSYSMNNNNSNNSGNRGRRLLFPKTSPWPPPSQQQLESTKPFDQYKSSALSELVVAVAPTEIITNRTSDHSYRHANTTANTTESIITSTPTEIVTNRTIDILSRVRNNNNAPFSDEHGRNREGGENSGSNGCVAFSERVQELQRRAMNNNNNNNSNTRSYQYHTSLNNNVVIPSLFDAQSQSSSLENGGSSNNNSNKNKNNHSNTRSRLCRHVESARQKSLLITSASETTASFTTTDMPSISSIDANIDRITTPSSRSMQKPLSTAAATTGQKFLSFQNNKARTTTNRVEQEQEKKQKQKEKEQVKSYYDRNELKSTTNTAATESLLTPRVWQKNKLGGLRRQAIAPGEKIRVTALAAQYRKRIFTARGVHHQQQQELNAEMNEDRIEDIPEAETSKTSNQVEPMSLPPDLIISHIGAINNDDDESTIPEYIDDTNNDTTRTDGGSGKNRAEDFVTYNQRPKQNTAGVFQSKASKFQEVDADANNQGTTRFDNDSGRSNCTDEIRKSPIQPLFSLDRLDESNSSSIQESSIRSRSLGRSFTSEQSMRIASNSDHNRRTTLHNDKDNECDEPQRRSKSLSQRSERKKLHQSTEISDAVREIARARRSRLTTNAAAAAAAAVASTHHQEQHVVGKLFVERVAGNKTYYGNVIENDTVKQMISERSRKSSSIRSMNRSDNVRIMIDRKMKLIPSPEKVSNERYSKPKDSPKQTISIKDKIRAFNLNKSPRDVREFDWSQERGERHYGAAQTVKSIARRSNEEKKNVGVTVNYLDVHSFDQDEESSVKSLRNKLEKEHLKAHYNIANDLSVESNNDEYSVQSLREQFEQKINTNQNDAGGHHFGGTTYDDDNGDDDDDKSVRSIREMFEPVVSKQKGEIVSNLKERFEQKPRVHRFCFNGTQNNLNQNREVAVLKEATIENRSFSPRNENDNRPIVSSTPTKLIHDRLTQWANRRQTEAKRVVTNINEGKDSDLHKSSNHCHSSDDTAHAIDLVAVANNDCYKDDDGTTGSNFRSTDSYKASSDDDSRKAPGLHWTAQGVGTDNEKSFQENVVAKLSSDSDYSDAVTLDASICEVSFLSNPSLLRSKDSKDSDRHSDASSSALFDGIDANPHSSAFVDSTITSPLSSSKSDCSGHIEWKIDMENFETEETLSKSNSISKEPLNGTSDNDSTMKRFSEENKSDARKQMHSKSTTKYYSKDFRDNSHNANTTGHGGHRLNDPDADYNDISKPSHDSKKAPIKETNHHFQDSKNEFTIQKRASTSYRVNHKTRTFESPITSKLPGSQPQSTPYTSQRHEDYTAHSMRSIDNPLQRLESSFRSSRSMDNLNNAIVTFSHPLRAMPNPLQASESSSRFNRPMDRQNRPVETSNRNEPLTKYTHEIDSPSSSRSCRSIGVQIRVPESSDRSTRSLGDTPSWRRYQSKPSRSERELQFQNDYGPSQEDVKTARQTSTIAKQPAVPSMPSPFDPDYAAIMESRHRILLSRQRLLLHRRANREKITKSHDGMFNRTHPIKIETKEQTTSVSQQNSKYVSKDTVYTNLQDQEAASTPIRNNRSNVSRAVENTTTRRRLSRTGSLPKESVRIPYTSLKEPKYIKQPTRNFNPRINLNPIKQNGTSSFVTKIKTTFGMSPTKPKRTAQNQAVVDRIVAVRVARLKRSNEYGYAGNQTNYRQRVIDCNILNDGQSLKLNTINNPYSSEEVTGYKYYPHDDRNNEYCYSRDDDHSFSTTESNAQEYAATLAID